MRFAGGSNTICRRLCQRDISIPDP